MTVTTAPTKPVDPKSKPPRDVRIIALRNFAISMTVFNILGYTVLGFEQAWTWPLIAIATGYALELTLEVIGARSEGRAPRFLGGGFKRFREFLYPAHITSLAVNLLMYVNDQVLVMMFGVAVGISGKWLLRAPIKGKIRHFMNPSNLGITAVLLLFPWASVVPPYHFTEHISGIWDWFVPGVIVFFGTMLNAKLTGRSWLIIAWLSGFVLQSVIRGVIQDISIPSAISTMTGVAFVLFTNYMITDPGTSPSSKWGQIAFGGGVAAAYGLVTGFGLVYGLFFATAAVCAIRGAFHWTLYFINRAQQARAVDEAPVAESAGPDASSNHRAVPPPIQKEAVPA